MSRKGLILFLMAGLAWGVPYLFIKFAGHEFSNASIIFVRVLVGALVLLPVAAGVWPYATVLAADVLGLAGGPLAVLAAVAGGAHAWRWALWQPWRTRRVPLVWVLHLAYLWVPVHLLLRAAGELGWVMPSVATHALTVGAVGAAMYLDRQAAQPRRRQ